MSFATVRSQPSPTPASASGSPQPAGGRLVAVDGRALPLLGATLAADAKGGLVRITLEQTFRNPHAEPLRVTYSLPLPADGAVSGFAFRLGDERVVGQVDTKQQARQRFEDAVLQGRTAALLDQERSSLFTQEVGNVPPRTQVVCEVTIDQKLAWLSDGAWEWRFPTVVAPRYLGGEGRVADGAKVSVDVADEALPVKLSLSLAIRDALAGGARPVSPSHSVHTGRAGGRTDVTFSDERGVGLDRDVVVRWQVSAAEPGTTLDLHRPASGPTAGSAYGLLTIVPPAPEAPRAPLPRDLIVLLDTSGSMSGMPLDQARRLTSALVDSLTEADQLELIEFSTSPRRWKRGAVAATPAHRRDAQAWLARLRASGGTEMRSGILEALAPLREGSQRQVVLITDGLIGFETEVLEAISKRLPRGSRVHTIGVGSGVNRSLTMPAARAGRGVELVLGLTEDVEPSVARLLARTHQPLLTEVEVSGSAVRGLAPARVPDLFGGAPALVSLELRPEGGELLVRARSAHGEVEERLTVPATGPGEGSPAVAALYAREAVEDLELNLAGGAPKGEIDAAVERLGLDFQISTRRTSWVAVSERQTVDPRAPRRHETMPHELAFGLSAEGVGLRAPAPQPLMRARHAAAPTEAAAFAPRRSQLGASAGAPPPPAGMAAQPSLTPLADASADRLRADEGALVEEELADDGALAEQESTGASLPPAAPKQEAPPAPEKRKGLADLARTFLTPKKAAAPSPTTTRTLQGRLVRRGRDQAVVELEVEGQALAWRPGAEARVELADGSLLKCRVVIALTTAEGQVAPGLVITLVLELDDRVATPVRIHLANGGEVLELRV